MATPKTISRETGVGDSSYKYGFVTDVETEIIPAGLNEDVVRLISEKKNEPEYMLEWRLRAFRHFLTLVEQDQVPATLGARFKYDHPI